MNRNEENVEMPKTGPFSTPPKKRPNAPQGIFVFPFSKDAIRLRTCLGRKKSEAIIAIVLFLAFLTSCSNTERREKECMDHLAQCTRYAERGQFEDAFREWRLADKAMPEDNLVWIDRSKLERMTGHTNAAVEAAYKSIAYTRPPETPSYVYTVHLLLEYSKPEEAGKLIEKALNDKMIIANEIPHVAVLECKIQLLMEENKMDDAISVCDQALKIVFKFDDESRSRILKIKAECESRKGS